MNWIKAKLINGATATGAQTAKAIGRPFKDHKIQISFSNAGGSCTALTVDLEGSIDGTNFSQMGQVVFSAGELSEGFATLIVTGSPTDTVRANITTLTDTGTTTINATYLGME